MEVNLFYLKSTDCSHTFWKKIHSLPPVFLFYSHTTATFTILLTSDVCVFSPTKQLQFDSILTLFTCKQNQIPQVKDSGSQDSSYQLQIPVASSDCHLCIWPTCHKSENPTTPSSGLINFLEQLTKLMEKFTFIYWFIKGNAEEYRWTVIWRNTQGKFLEFSKLRSFCFGAVGMCHPPGMWVYTNLDVSKPHL